MPLIITFYFVFSWVKPVFEGYVVTRKNKERPDSGKTELPCIMVTIFAVCISNLCLLWSLVI